MKEPSVIKSDELSEYYFKEGCHILEILNSAEDPALSIARARVTAGVTTRLHALKGITERYYITSGSGVVTVGDKIEAVSRGDVVIIPPDIPQQIFNSSDEDLIFLALCTPRFVVDRYREV